MNKTMDLEVKVGLFVTIGIGLIMLAILVLGSSQNLLSRKNHYYIHVGNVEGLIQGAKVVLGGVQIGTVESIKFDMQRRDVVVDLSVSTESSNWIRKDSDAEIATQGVLGDKFVSIAPGTEGQPQIPPGEEIPVRPGKSLTQFISRGDQLLVTLNNVALSLDRVLKNFEHGGRSDVFFQGMATTAKNLSNASEKLNHEIEEIRLKKIVKNLEQITDKINNGSGTIGALLNDPSLYDHAKSLIGEANRNRIVRNLVRQTIKESEENAAPPKDGESAKKSK